jgi:septal ring factor EnvC (AmiA/AmiB activator)
MVASTLLFLSFVLVPVSADTVVSVAESQANANPIRKVVTMLQNMQKKVAAEGKKEKELFEKFMCYCQTGESELQGSITTADTKISELDSSVREAIAQKAQLEVELKAAQTDRAEAKEAIAKATALREKEAKAFTKESTDYKTNIEALKGAISAISTGMSGSFLQTTLAATVRKIAMNGPNMEDTDRQELISFLSGEQTNGYVPKSGEIVGILKQMEDEMTKSLELITADEDAAIASYKELMAAKSKEIESLTEAIESKSKRSGNLAVEIAMMQNDLEDTTEALAQDKKFLADLSKNCATKEAEWDEIQAMRAQEMVALADTIKILNDDDALELFKKTLPSAAGFLQVAVSAKAMRAKALEIIRKVEKNQPSNKVALGFVEFALQGKLMQFDKVIKMIDNMVSDLKKEQTDDDAKRDYCNTEIDAAEDKKKSLDQTIKDLGTSIADAEEGIATTKSEIEALQDGIKALDKSVAEATEQRKEEHEDYTELMASDNSAKELLHFAKNRLNKFYNPKLYKPAPKRTLSEEDSIVVSMGGSLAPTAAPGGIAGTGIAFVEIAQHSVKKAVEAPPPAPEAPGPFKKKTEESNGVIAMIDLLVKDLDKEMQEADVTEKDAQKEYESMMADSAAKRAEDSKTITDKSGIKAQLESELQASKESKDSATKELLATVEYQASLHKECDWLLKYFDVRKEARASEIDALGKAKAVLSGADYSLLQKNINTRFLQPQ